MPGMNGGQVSAAIFANEEVRHIPLVFLSGTVAPHELRRLQGTVGRPALTKSTPLPELVARIEAMIRPQAS